MNKNIFLMLGALWSSILFSQKTLNGYQAPQTIQDNTSIRMLPGFHANSNDGSYGSSSFIARIGDPSGSTNPPANIGNINASSGENYIYTRSYLVPVNTSNANAPQIQSIQYFDGLGRPKQNIAIKSTPQGQDLVTTIPYDGFGRQVDSWLPVPMSTMNSGIQSGVESTATGFYSDTNPYTHQTLENSPLDRVMALTQVGSAWQGNPVEYSYLANENNEVLKIITVTEWQNGITKTSSLKIEGYYTAATLYKNKISDEDDNISYEFKNGQGQTIMVRKELNATEKADTYYIYNEYDQLAFVISPLAATEFKNNSTQTIADPENNATFNSLCYQYKYDGRNRLAEKKLPGKGWEYMVYDKQDRLVMSADTRMFDEGQWLFNKYDQFGRVAFTGITTGGDRASEQSTLNGITPNNVKRETSIQSTVNGMGLMYSQTGTYPTTITELLSINYYDTYPVYGDSDLPSLSGSDSFGQKYLSDFYTPSEANPNTQISTKGLPTASLVKNIGEDKWTKNYTYYDQKARPISTYSFNHLGGYTVSGSLLDFSGVVLKSFTKHQRKSGFLPAEVLVQERFVYDHQNRLKQHFHQVNGNSEVLLAENYYDELGRLDHKKVGDNIQDVKYTYNIRGWMTGINSADIQYDAAGPSYSLSNGKLFGYRIKYNDPENTSVATAKYNGNISEVDWISHTGSLKRYGYQYDGMNRMLAGIYQDPGRTVPETNINNETLTYDLNGNIKTLVRNAKHGKLYTPVVIDNLTYQYVNTNKSNRLYKITDASNNISGYEGGGTAIDYDENGNMINMTDKGISAIIYNHLNLPIQLNQNTNITNYYYRSDGTKIKKKYTLVNASGTTVINTEYLDGFQYSTPNTEPIRKALKETDDSTISALKAGEEEAFSSSEERLIDPGNPPSVESIILSFFPTPEGYYDFENNRYIYQYKDHLGNVRISYVKDGSTGDLKIMDRNDYYPFGMSFLKPVGESSVYDPMAIPYNYKYQGQELQETGFYSFKWRNYMPDVGRFFNIDPLAEKYDDYTPYQFSSNQPVHAKELEGLESSNDLNKRVSPQQRAISDKRVQAYAAEAKRNFSNVFNGTLSLKPKFGALGGEVGVTLGPLKGNVGAAVAKVEGSLNTQKPSIKGKAEGLSAEGSLGVKNAKMEGSIAAISMEAEGSLKNGKPSGEFNAQGGKVVGKITSGDISLDLSDLKIGGELKVFKALHIGVEVNLGEAIKGTVNTINMVGTAVQNYFQEKLNDVKDKINSK